jgi:competence protein ComEA
MIKSSQLGLIICACLMLPHAAISGPVDINSADANVIAKELKGLGIVRARAIVAYRNKNGPFKSAQDLAKVKSIGKKMIQKNLANIRVESAKPAVTTGGAPEKSDTVAAGGMD